MAFERLDSVVKRVVSRIANEVGEGLSVAAEPDAVKLPKGTGTEAPAKSREEIVHPRQQPEPTTPRATQPAKAASLGNAKGRRTHPHELAPLGVRQPLMLRVVEGGRPAQGGGEGRAACARLPGGASRSKHVKLVHSASSS